MPYALRVFGLCSHLPGTEVFFLEGSPGVNFNPPWRPASGGGDLPVDFPWNPVHLLGQLSPVFAYELHGQGLVGEAHVHDAGDP